MLGLTSEIRIEVSVICHEFVIIHEVIGLDLLLVTPGRCQVCMELLSSLQDGVLRCSVLQSCLEGGLRVAGAQRVVYQALTSAGVVLPHIQLPELTLSETYCDKYVFHIHAIRMQSYLA